jgi:hypothetical protein
VIPLVKSCQAEEDFIFYIVDYLKEVKFSPNQMDHTAIEKTVKIPIDIREDIIVSCLLCTSGSMDNASLAVYDCRKITALSNIHR